MSLYGKLFVGFISLLSPIVASAEAISIAELPVLAENKDEGILVDFVKALQDGGGNAFNHSVVPFARSLRMVSTGESDAHLPFLDPENGNPPAPGLAYSDVTIFQVDFALYYNKAKPIALPISDDALKLETEASHVPLFPFQLEGSTCLPCSLKKLDAGRIDGFVFAKRESDKIIEQNGLANIEQVEYRSFPAKFVIREGDQATNTALVDAVEKFKQDSSKNAILSPLQ